MDPVFGEETRRLQQFRTSLVEQNKEPEISSSSGERRNLDGFSFRNQNGVAGRGGLGGEQKLMDPLIYPGLYAPSGFDIMGILIRVRTRPNPKIALGNVDSAVALVVCDPSLPDLPIVYSSEPFSVLTGYDDTEILGRNCRFLQQPQPEVSHSQVPSHHPEQIEKGEEINRLARTELTTSFERGEEARVRLVNYTKGGRRFVNILTTIPITWEEGRSDGAAGKRYIVGFQADEQGVLGT